MLILVISENISIRKKYQLLKIVPFLKCLIQHKSKKEHHVFTLQKTTVLCTSTTVHTTHILHKTTDCAILNY